MQVHGELLGREVYTVVPNPVYSGQPHPDGFTAANHPADVRHHRMDWEPRDWGLLSRGLLGPRLCGLDAVVGVDGAIQP